MLFFSSSLFKSLVLCKYYIKLQWRNITVEKDSVSVIGSLPLVAEKMSTKCPYFKIIKNKTHTCDKKQESLSRYSWKE